MIITFSGVDGSGKTTIAKLLVKKLRKKSLNAIYRREFDYFLLDYLKKIVNLIGKKGGVEIIKQRVLIGKKSPLIGKLWVYLTFFDLLLEYLHFKIFYRNRIIIMDRCIFDFLVGWQWIGYSGRLVKWLYLKFPKFDFSYILDIDPQIAYERKKEEQDNDLYFFTTLRNMYLDLYRKRKEIIFLDSSNDKEMLLGEVLNNIFKVNKGILSP